MLVIGLCYTGCGSNGSTDYSNWNGDGDGDGDGAGETAVEPVVTSVEPATLSPGVECTINGSGFGSERSTREEGQSYVSFESSEGGSGIEATEYILWSDNQIKCIVPELEEEGGYDDIFVHDRQSGATTRVSVASDGTPANANCFVPDM